MGHKVAKSSEALIVIFEEKMQGPAVFERYIFSNDRIFAENDCFFDPVNGWCRVQVMEKAVLGWYKFFEGHADRSPLWGKIKGTLGFQFSMTTADKKVRNGVVFVRRDLVVKATTIDTVKTLAKSFAPTS